MGCEHLKVGNIYGISMVGVNRRVIVVDINAKLDKVIIVPISSLDHEFFMYDLWTRHGVFQCWNMRVIPMRAFDNLDYMGSLPIDGNHILLIEAIVRLLLGSPTTSSDDALKMFDPSRESKEETLNRINLQAIEKNTVDMLVNMISG